MAIEKDLDKIAMDLIKAFIQFKKIRIDESQINAVGGCQNLKHSEVMLLFSVKEMRHDRPEGISVSDLSTHIGVKPPTITPIITSLEKRSLLSREIDSADRRIIRVRLTGQGEQFTDRAAKALIKRIKGLVNYLGVNKSTQLSELLNDVFVYMSDVMPDKNLSTM